MAVYIYIFFYIYKTTRNIETKLEKCKWTLNVRSVPRYNCRLIEHDYAVVKPWSNKSDHVKNLVLPTYGHHDTRIFQNYVHRTAAAAAAKMEKTYEIIFLCNYLGRAQSKYDNFFCFRAVLNHAHRRRRYVLF